MSKKYVVKVDIYLEWEHKSQQIIDSYKPRKSTEHHKIQRNDELFSLY